MLLSIITTVKDDPIGIYITIKSVLNQDFFKKTEYIIVDASSKNNVSLIINDLIKNKNFKNIKYIKSKDKSFYEGINKGIKAAHGTHIGILNSGDVYCSRSVLKKISSEIEKKPLTNIIFGKVIFYDTHGVTRNWIEKKSYIKLSPFLLAHPACFIRKNILVKHNYYSTKYDISADFNFFVIAIKDLSSSFVYIDKNITFMKAGGLSTSFLKLPIKVFEDLSILFKNYSLFFLFFYIKKIVIKLPGIFFLRNRSYYYRVLQTRFFEISKK